MFAGGSEPGHSRGGEVWVVRLVVGELEILWVCYCEVAEDVRRSWEMEFGLRIGIWE